MMHITIYYYLDQVLGTSAIGCNVLKDVTATFSSMFGLKSIFGTNEDQCFFVDDDENENFR